MNNGEKLKAGVCTSDPSLAVESKEYTFNSSSNMFLSIGGAPSEYWRSLGASGIKSFLNMELLDYYSEFDMSSKYQQLDMWISPLDKRTGDKVVVTYPSFIQKTQCATAVMRYGQFVELMVLDENDFPQLPPPWITTTAGAMTV